MSAPDTLRTGISSLMTTTLRDNIANSECGTEKLCGRRIERLSHQWMVSVVRLWLARGRQALRDFLAVPGVAALARRQRVS